jgi:hypothetical protein
MSLPIRAGWEMLSCFSRVSAVVNLVSLRCRFEGEDSLSIIVMKRPIEPFFIICHQHQDKLRLRLLSRKKSESLTDSQSFRELAWPIPAPAPFSNDTLSPYWASAANSSNSSSDLIPNRHKM